MNVVLITQDEPFFLAEALDYLLQNLPNGVRVGAAILLSPSPFGRKETMFGKVLKTWRVFGTAFLLHYMVQFLMRHMRRDLDVPATLTRRSVPVIRLDAGINAPESLARIHETAPDVLVSIAGNEIFKRSLINLAPKGCLNLHSALLPKYRGLMPSFWALRYNEPETGVSVFCVDEGIDTGPILVQKRIEVGDMTQEALIRRSKRIGMDAILEAIEMLRSDDVHFIPNDDATASYFGFPTRKDVQAFRKAGARFF